MIKTLLVRCGLVAGLLLSIASAMNLCPTDACTQTHQYTFMGLSVPLTGIIFFVASGVTYELGRKKELFAALFFLFILGAGGAEVAFILIQKYRIQKWCPLCLGIAGTVYLIAAVVASERAAKIRSMFRDRRIMFMSLVRKVSVVAVVFIAGFFTAYNGMRPGEAAAEPNIFLGKQSSNIEVYIMTDWFCPACMKAEQEIERSVPAVEKKAKIIFVDVPIHPESVNYTPYNLSFLTNEKGKYMELRKALLGLTKKTKQPTDADVRDAVKPLNVTLKPLSFLDATKGMKFYDTTAREFQVSATPTVVIRDVKTKKVTKLVGIKEITEANIAKAVDQLGH